MRIKGISWIEQHFEKLVAALFGAALLGVLAWQFGAPQGATVKINNADVPITSANEKLAEIARGAKGRIEQTEPPALEGVDQLQSTLNAASKTMKGPVAPVKELPAPLGEVARIQSDAVPGGGAKGASGLPTYAMIKPGVATRPVAASNLSSIHPAEAQNAEVAKVLPAALPYDFASVSVESTFSGAELKAALLADPDGEGPLSALPSTVIDSGRIQILVVEAERQELKPDGTWSEASPVQAMPGRFSLAAEASQTMQGVQALDGYVKLAGERATDVRRPAYYALFQGEDWVPPSERIVVQDADKGKRIDRLKRDYLEKQKRLRAARDELATLPPADPQGGRPQPTRPAAPPPGGGVGGRGGGGGDRQPPPRDAGPSPAQLQAKRRNLESTVKTLSQQLERILAELKNLGADTADLPMDNAGDGVDAPIPTDPAASASKADGPLLDDPAVRLWVHDVRVARGKTYRYRLRPVFSNPLFMQFNQLSSEQQDMAKAPVVRGEYSEWSDPVTTEANQYYFVTGASVPGELQRVAGARVEIYTFAWGFWRRANAQIEPGDRVHGVAKGVPDFTKQAEAAKANAPVPGQPNDPGAGNPAGGGAGGGVVGGGVGGGGRRSPRDDGRDNRAPDPAPNDPSAAAKPADLETKDIEISVDAVLLGIGLDPMDSAGGGREDLVAFLREALGIVTRNPTVESESGLLLRLRASADRGMAALRPKAPPQQDPARGPDRDTPPDAPLPSGPRPAPGGGG